MSKAYTDFVAPAKAVAVSTPPASGPIPGREKEMAANNGGGFTFTMDHWGVLDRFLMLGSEDAGYYVGQKETTKLSFVTVEKCVKEDGVRVVNRALEYSLAGRAPKNDPAVVAIALAAVHGDDETKAAAYDALPRIARTGTWLFLFVAILDSLGKWNAAAKRGVAKWYTGKTIEKMTIQVLKYQQRNGWSHRDILRLAHVKPENELQQGVFRYIAKKGELEQGTQVPQLLIDFEHMKRAEDKKTVLKLIEQSDFLTWEMVPTQYLKDKDVLFALLKNMGLTAMIRKLGALTAHGVVAPLSEGSKLVLAKLGDVEQLKRARVHPITLLQALKQYQVGHGEKGSLTWSADQRILTGLDEAFYAAFGAVDVTPDNYMLGIDISGSMTGANVNGSPNLTAAEVAAVMGMAVAKNQPNHFMVGFKHDLEVLKISPSMRLDAALKVMRDMHWSGGSTDPAKVFEYAQSKRIPVDKFVIITDNEVNCGHQAPAQALVKYRKSTGLKAKCIVIATSVSNFTIADPKDAGMLDIAGFDSAAPQLIANL